MGTCQSSEAATVVIHHPGNKVERIYWSVRAQDIMNSNPGHYVAFVVTPPSTTTSSSSRAENNGGVAPNNSRQFKLLRPNDTLLMGQVYRLISFEDVIKELAAKKSVKLGKLLKESGVLNQSLEPTSKPHNSSSFQQVDQEVVHGLGNNNGSGASSSNKSSYRGVGRQHGGGKGGQWKPALQSISEIGT